MTLDEAIKFLKSTIKESAVPGQKHLDNLLLSASEKKKFDEAMQVVHKAIYDEEISLSTFQSQVGLV